MLPAARARSADLSEGDGDAGLFPMSRARATGVLGLLGRPEGEPGFRGFPKVILEPGDPGRTEFCAPRGPPGEPKLRSRALPAFRAASLSAARCTCSRRSESMMLSMRATRLAVRGVRLTPGERRDGQDVLITDTNWRFYMNSE